MIEIDRLHKVVGQSTVLAIESLRVGAGEVAAIIEAEASGAPALVALLTGQSRPAAGSLVQALGWAVTGGAPLGPVWGNLAVLAACAVVTLAAAVWRLRREES